jgi:hypothetical protein
VAVMARHPLLGLGHRDAYRCPGPGRVERRASSVGGPLASLPVCQLYLSGDTLEDASIAPNALPVQALVTQLRTTLHALATFDQASAQHAQSQPDCPFCAAMPCAGAGSAPRLLVAFREQRNRYTSADELQKYAGITPVTACSSNKTWGHWCRMLCRGWPKRTPSDAAGSRYAVPCRGSPLSHNLARGSCKKSYSTLDRAPQNVCLPPCLGASLPLSGRGGAAFDSRNTHAVRQEKGKGGVRQVVLSETFAVFPSDAADAKASSSGGRRGRGCDLQGRRGSCT